MVRVAISTVPRDTINGHATASTSSATRNSFCFTVEPSIAGRINFGPETLFSPFWKAGRKSWKKKTTAVPINTHCQRMSEAVSTTSLVPSSSSCTPIKTPARTKNIAAESSAIAICIGFILSLPPGDPEYRSASPAAPGSAGRMRPHLYIPYSDRQKRAPPQSPRSARQSSPLECCQSHRAPQR